MVLFVSIQEHFLCTGRHDIEIACFHLIIPEDYFALLASQRWLHGLSRESFPARTFTPRNRQGLC